MEGPSDRSCHACPSCTHRGCFTSPTTVAIRVFFCDDLLAGSWNTIPTRCEHIRECAAALVAGRLFVAGGSDMLFGAGVSNISKCFDPATAEWETLQAMPTPRFQCTAA